VFCHIFCVILAQPVSSHLILRVVLQWLMRLVGPHGIGAVDAFLDGSKQSSICLKILGPDV
jgi:hypothetical protein